MVIRARQRNVVYGFFREDLSEVSIFRQERDFGFHLFCGNGKFCCHNEFGNKWGVQEEVLAITLEDPIDLAIVQGVLEVLVLYVMV